ncbi:nucleoside triphosphate pyrophosphohydrolase family protein [Salibacteraceae bacterium]|nr:nucleoside triphosphate pyrophosphohydrolase family protein [Salibacteraceae bacterium]MDB9708956.1 nucleoside triphosphate pyrophosphohydrolase family protein [Salibacteraceae bacterium]
MAENNLSDMKLSEVINHVKDFHNAFKIKNNESPTIDIDDKSILLRYKLMREENEEYLEAAQEGDLVEVADALGDMLYILCGTILSHGMQYKIAEVFEEIQRSNMSKLDKDGQPIYREDGKVMKSDLYFKPNIQNILDK